MKYSILGSKLCAVLVVSLLGGSACTSFDEGDADLPPIAANGGGTTQWWEHKRAARQEALDAYVAANVGDYRSFKNAPLGNSGIPMVMFRLFPELFPGVWSTEDDAYGKVGLVDDTLEPSRTLPLGMGYSGSVPAVPTPAGPVNIQVVALTCMGCHGGRVEGPDGEVKHLLGAPNTQFNQLRLAAVRTVQQPGYTADAFRAALAAKPLGWLYNDPAMLQQEALERAIFLAPGAAENFVAGFRARVLGGAARFNATLGAHTYAVPDAPDLLGDKPGYLDAIGTGITAIVDPAVHSPAELAAILPPAPAEIDIMSVWLQADRPVAQWDGSIASPLHRNLAAEFGVIQVPTALNMDNANRTTRFTEHLPAPPYPFQVRRNMAARGEELYEASCAGCHGPGESAIFPTAEVGTDPNRADIWTPFVTGTLAAVLRASCTDPVTCVHPDGTPFADDELVKDTGGYMAVPLDGLWARAPYLHNGSVPTLRALLTGDRPTTFYRGRIAYDQADVGFAWDAPGPGAALYDTTRAGNSNGGHDTPEFNGYVDWANEPAKLNDLLEYLKTL